MIKAPEPEKKKRGRKRKADTVSALGSAPSKKKIRTASYGNIDKPTEEVCLASTALITDQQLSNSVIFKPIFSNLTSYPTTSNKPCNQCDYGFEGIPILIPLDFNYRDEKYEFHPRVQFCSFPCLCRYIQENHKNNPGFYSILAHRLARNHFNVLEPIEAAPPKCTLRHMGGELEVEQYRKVTHAQILHTVPCVSQIMVMEQFSNAEGKKNPSDDEQVFSIKNIQKRMEMFSKAQSLNPNIYHVSQIPTLVQNIPIEQQPIIIPPVPSVQPEFIQTEFTPRSVQPISSIIQPVEISDEPIATINKTTEANNPKSNKTVVNAKNTVSTTNDSSPKPTTSEKDEELETKNMNSLEKNKTGFFKKFLSKRK